MVVHAIAGQKGRDMLLTLQWPAKAKDKDDRGGYGAYARKWR